MARTGEKRMRSRFLVRKPEENGPYVGPRLRWEDDIKRDLQEIWEAVSWMNLAQDTDS